MKKLRRGVQRSRRDVVQLHRQGSETVFADVITEATLERASGARFEAGQRLMRGEWARTARDAERLRMKISLLDWIARVSLGGVFIRGLT